MEDTQPSGPRVTRASITPFWCRAFVPSAMLSVPVSRESSSSDIFSTWQSSRPIPMAAMPSSASFQRAGRQLGS